MRLLAAVFLSLTLLNASSAIPLEGEAVGPSRGKSYSDLSNEARVSNSAEFDKRWYTEVSDIKRSIADLEAPLAERDLQGPTLESRTGRTPNDNPRPLLQPPRPLSNPAQPQDDTSLAHQDKPPLLIVGGHDRYTLGKWRNQGMGRRPA